MKSFILLIVMSISINALSLDEKVAYLNNVKELIVLTQTMRGNTNVYTKSENMDVSVVESDRKEVSASLKGLHAKFKMVDSSVDKEFKKLNKYMQSLNMVAVELDTLTAFKANTLLIKEMLRIGGEVQTSFFINEIPLRKEASKMMMQRVMPLTEDLGQLRGLSAGAVACRNCSDDEGLEYIKDYLAYTYDDLDAFVIQMKALKNSYPKAYAQDLKLEEYEKDVKHFLVHIEEVVLEGREIKPEECDFFVQGTKVIDKTLGYYKMNEKVLN